MKHHISSSELKLLKKYLWNMRSQIVNIQFYVNDELQEDHHDIRLLNYGIIQTDENENVLSDKKKIVRVNYHNRKVPEYIKESELDFFILSLDVKGYPQISYHIVSTGLTMNVDTENKTITVEWKSLKGESRKLVIVSTVELSTVAQNSRNFSMTRNLKSLKDIKKEALATGKSIEEVSKKYVREENMKKGGSWKVDKVTVKLNKKLNKKNDVE